MYGLSAIQIVPATAQHVGILTTLIGEFLQEHSSIEHAFVPARGWEEVCREALRLRLGHPECRALLAMQGATPVGFVLYGFVEEAMMTQSRQGHISDLYVRPKWRKQGIGEELAGGALEELQSSRPHYVQLNVHVENDAAQRFWERLGFKPYLYRMKLDLSGSMASDG